MKTNTRAIIVLAFISIFFLITGSSFGEDALYVNPSGNVGIGTPDPDAKLNVQGGTDVEPDLSHPGYIVTGDLSGENIGIDTNEIMARNNGATSPLYIQLDGGNTVLNYGGGSVGIGTSAPDAKLNVQGGTDVAPTGGGFIITGDLSGYNIGMDNNEIMARNNGATSPLYLQAEGGNTIIGGNLKLHNKFYLDMDDDDWIRLLDGDDGSYQDYGIAAYKFYSHLAQYTWSDKRSKEDIKTIPDALDKITQLEGVSFKLKESGDSGIGLIAQDVEKVFPEAVAEGPDGYKAIAYGNLVGPIIQAIKELRTQNDELKERIIALEKAIAQ